jgi:YegS/Rv2252/BmrU family lipid kinase
LNVNLIVNPIAGNRAYKSIDRIETILKKKVSLKTFVTQKRGDAFEFAKKLSDTDLIMVVSGDGTINEVINGICTSQNHDLRDVPITLIPRGITNVLAKELRIPHKIEDAIDLALNGRRRKVSLGRINGRYFASMAGIGFDGETVLRVKDNFVKKISGKAAHIIAGLKVLKQYKPSLINIKTANTELTGYTAVIGNVRNYAGYFSVTPRAYITEPVLDICIFRGKTRRDMLRFITGVILGKHLQFPDVMYVKASEMTITSIGKVHIQIDGDYFGTLPAKIEVVRDAISMIW